MSMLEIKNLNAGYNDLHILKDVNLDLPNGQISVLMGPNGAGKSTLIKSMYNLTNIISGKIIFNGLDITHWPAHKLIRLGISYVPQGKINFFDLTVEENLLIGGYHIGDKVLIKQRIDEIYAKFPVLEIKRKQLAFSLSGGQQQLLALGRALMGEPKLLLLDEPSLGLAPRVVKEVFMTIQKINQEFGTTILVVEHNIKSFLDVAHYGYVLVEGRIVADDESAKLKNSGIMKQVFVGKLE